MKEDVAQSESKPWVKLIDEWKANPRETLGDLVARMRLIHVRVSLSRMARAMWLSPEALKRLENADSARDVSTSVLIKLALFLNDPIAQSSTGSTRELVSTLRREVSAELENRRARISVVKKLNSRRIILTSEDVNAVKEEVRL